MDILVFICFMNRYMSAEQNNIGRGLNVLVVDCKYIRDIWTILRIQYMIKHL